MIRKPSKQDGFTLIELLVVVVIIGILASVAVPNFMGAQDKAKNSGVQSNGHTVQMSLEQYAVDNASVYPADLGSVIASGSSYLTAYPRHPWNGTQTAHFAAATQALNADIGAGAIEAAPSTTAKYGAIGYSRSGTANEQYTISGSGKNGGNARVVFKVQNF